MLQSRVMKTWPSRWSHKDNLPSHHISRPVAKLAIVGQSGGRLTISKLSFSLEFNLKNNDHIPWDKWETKPHQAKLSFVVKSHY